MRLPDLKIILISLVLSASAQVDANPLFSVGRGKGLLERPEAVERSLRPQQLHNSTLSSREAVAIAERRYGGRAVGIRQIQSHSGMAYKVRILQDNGKIKNVIIDHR